MIRLAGRALIAILAAAAIIYLSDWAVWRVRMARGIGMSTVTVNTMIDTPLKGSKIEYDWAGTSDVDCSRSVFPQAGSGSCWWLRRHPTIEEK
jgi:hypothetical protein